MDEMRDKMKGLMNKVNKPFSSSSFSGKFKGQGRTLGSSSSSPSPSPSSQSLPSNSTFRASNVSDDKKPVVTKVNLLDVKEKSENGFDPFDSLITSGKRNPNGYSLKGFECPICAQLYISEEEVSAHVELCLSTSSAAAAADSVVVVTEGGQESENRLQSCVNAYASGNASKEVVLRLLRNVVKEPHNPKFRKIRMGNPKIKEAIGDVPGAVELLECIGFELTDEDGEMWLVMEVPSMEQLELVKNVLSLLEPKKVEESSSSTAPTKPNKVEESSSSAPSTIHETVEPRKVDRQIRVFFSVSESVAARIELPDSFYNLSADEVKREADARRKKLEESKLLIPKSYREKQTKAGRKRYNKTVIRIQFPDGVVLQAIFSPSEQTSALYEFVSSSLKEPSLEFELLHPVLIKRRVIPHSPAAGKKTWTLEEEDLVPAALIKFRPIETDSVVFTGLCNELLQISEPLVSGSAVPAT